LLLVRGQLALRTRHVSMVSAEERRQRRVSWVTSASMKASSNGSRVINNRR
jgi:hypothetical protein